jgi:hypothetical protein
MLSTIDGESGRKIAYQIFLDEELELKRIY